MSLNIAIRDLHKSFGEKVVLAGLDLDVAAGESLAVIGQSGTGKSVLTHWAPLAKAASRLVVSLAMAAGTPSAMVRTT